MQGMIRAKYVSLSIPSLPSPKGEGPTFNLVENEKWGQLIEGPGVDCDFSDEWLARIRNEELRKEILAQFAKVFAAGQEAGRKGK